MDFSPGDQIDFDMLPGPSSLIPEQDPETGMSSNHSSLPTGNSISTQRSGPPDLVLCHNTGTAQCNGYDSSNYMPSVGHGSNVAFPLNYNNVNNLANERETLVIRPMTEDTWTQLVPTNMPWEGVSTTPSITEERTIFHIPSTSRSQDACATRVRRKMKRKAGKSEECPQAKSFVAEERMAAQMNALSLDGEPSSEQEEINSSWANRLAGWEQTQHQSDSGNSSCDDSDTERSDRGSQDPGNSSAPRLQIGSVLKRELKRSTERMRRALLADFASLKPVPCRELVLWQPKPDLLKEAICQRAAPQSDLFRESMADEEQDVPRLLSAACPSTASSVDILPLGEDDDLSEPVVDSVNLNLESGELEYSADMEF